MNKKAKNEKDLDNSRISNSNVIIINWNVALIYKLPVQFYSYE